jgi:SAM-dependent methyltransferase
MDESVIANVKQLAQSSWEKGDPVGWFETLYASADGDVSVVPWAKLTANPNLVNWIKQHQIQGNGKKALVVGCGLGDDAEALAQVGFDVTAFDISPTAIAWCQKRFPNSTVTYCVADLFDAPKSWQRSFDFVLESYTLQSLTSGLRDRAIACTASFVGDRGTLLVICRGRNSEDPEGDLPFPLTKNELNTFQKYGLKEVAFMDFLDRENARQVRRFCVQYELRS